MIELETVLSKFAEMQEAHGDDKLRLYASLRAYVENNSGMDNFTNEARTWINAKYDKLLGQQ